MSRKPALILEGADGLVATTRASAVYSQLRSDITHGALEPGSRLRVEAMSKRYGVGASPLREALSRLSAEGLVERSDQRGFAVSTLKFDELPVLTHSRIELESLVLRESIAARDTAWEERLVLLVHRLSRTPRSLSQTSYQPNPEWETLHHAFHRALLSQCPSRWLLGFCETLAEEIYRFRQVAAGRGFSKRNEHAEHSAIFEAAIAGNADLAVKLLAEHYSRTSKLVAAEVRKKATT